MAYEPTPETIEEARRRSVERLKANGHVARRLNGHDHAPAAPAAEINWAQVIGQVAAEQELSCDRKILAFKEHVTELIAKNSGGISDGEINALAKGFAEAVKPLRERLAKLEQRPRHEGATFKVEWVCAEPNTNDTRSCEECGSRGPRMRKSPILLNETWLALSKRPSEFLCIECVQQRCRERLGRELTRNDLRGCDFNRSWSVIKRASS
jgi:hypothetical protein